MAQRSSIIESLLRPAVYKSDKIYFKLSIYPPEIDPHTKNCYSMLFSSKVIRKERVNDLTDADSIASPVTPSVTVGAKNRSVKIRQLYE